LGVLSDYRIAYIIFVLSDYHIAYIMLGVLSDYHIAHITLGVVLACLIAGNTATRKVRTSPYVMTHR